MRPAVLLLALLMPWLARAADGADDGREDALRLSGFGSVVASRHDSAHALLRTTAQQSRGAADDWTLRNDSVLGLQARWRPHDDVDLTLQLLSRHNWKNNFDPQIDWAYVAWRPMPGLSLRAGRFIAPLLMVSDARNVNYANPWVRPPLEVYGLLTLNNVDGVDAIWKGALGDWTWAVQPFAGRFKLKINNNATVDYHRMAGVNASLQSDALMLRAAFFDSSHSLENAAGVFNVFRAQIAAPGCGAPPGTPGPGCETVYPGFADIANRLDVDRKRFDVATVGATWDDGRWLLQAEYVRRMTGSVVASGRAWYVSAGHRFGTWMPYVVVSRHRSDTERWTLAPAPAYATRAPLVLGNSATDQSSVSLGLRWDPRRNIALKVQYDRLRPEPGRFGPTHGNGNLQPLVLPPAGRFLSDYGAVRMLAVSLDFVF